MKNLPIITLGVLVVIFVVLVVVDFKKASMPGEFSASGEDRDSDDEEDDEDEID